MCVIFAQSSNELKTYFPLILRKQRSLNFLQIHIVSFELVLLSCLPCNTFFFNRCMRDTLDIVNMKIQVWNIWFLKLLCKTHAFGMNITIKSYDKILRIGKGA